MGISFNNVIVLIIVAIIQNNYVFYYDYQKIVSHNHKFPVQIKNLKDYIFDIYEKIILFLTNNEIRQEL